MTLQEKLKQDVKNNVDGAKKALKAHKELKAYLDLQPESVSESCDVTNPTDPHYEDAGYGWYDKDCVWHWFM